MDVLCVHIFVVFCRPRPVGFSCCEISMDRGRNWRHEGEARLHELGVAFAAHGDGGAEQAAIEIHYEHHCFPGIQLRAPHVGHVHGH